MAICLKHSQQYDPAIGEWCPYCGKPKSNCITSYTTSGKWKEDSARKKKKENKKNGCVSIMRYE